MRHRLGLLVVRLRQVRVAGVARTVRVCSGPGAIRSQGAQTASGLNCRREPPRPAIASQLAAPTRCQIMFRPRHDAQAFPSLYMGSRGRRGLEPPSVHQGRDEPPGRWDNADRTPAPALQTKPVTPASRLVAQEAPLVASKLRPRILAAGPATTDSTPIAALACPIPKFVAVAMSSGELARRCPTSENWSGVRLETEYGRCRAVIGRCCSNLSRRPPRATPASR